MSDIPSILDSLRDASAQDRLLVITGAGVSQGMKRDDGSPLPNWGSLVQALRDRTDLKRIDPTALAVLDDLLPPGLLEQLHGDALIEASEILKSGFDDGRFESAVAELCREEGGQCTETHRAIAQAAPAGIVTFNYDLGHEEAFNRLSVPFEPLIYSQEERLRTDLVRRDRQAPFLLKAHGCVTDPSSLVLTSSSYRKVLSGNRAYRAFLQHILIRHTVVIVGFAMRDRDFDQLLNTLEIELGGPLNRHAIITLRPPATEKGLLRRAEWAAITARFGVEPLYVDDFASIPDVIRSISDEPGPFVRALVTAAQSVRSTDRSDAHEQIGRLGTVGRLQVKAALLKALDDPSLAAEARSEVLYSLRSIGNGDLVVTHRLVEEVQTLATASRAAPTLLQVEGIAHALLALRSIRVSDSEERKAILARLGAAGHLEALRKLDDWQERRGGVRRLVAYTEATRAEIESRART